jgi:rhodanese-related sulfurtransferase
MKLPTALFIIAATVVGVSAAPAKTSTPSWPANALIVDVRTVEEYAAGRIPGAVLFPYDELQARASAFAALVGEAGKNRPIVVYCRTGRRSSIAARTLASQGYRNVTDFGGIDRWKGPLEK